MEDKLSKKISIIFIILLIFITCILLYFIFGYKNNLTTSNNTKLSKLLIETKSKYKIIIPAKQFNNEINIINNNKLSQQERYEALKNLIFILKYNYQIQANPSLRKDIISMQYPAKELLPTAYNQGTFAVNCSDPECGEKFDSEIEKIINNINNLKVGEMYKDTILFNLKSAIYIPINSEDDKLNKTGGLKLSYEQLLKLENPEASKSAVEFKNYVKNKYNISL